MSLEKRKQNSQYDPDSDQYTYSPHGLIFSDEAIARADGKSGLILYEIRHPESNHLNKLVLINAPLSRQAIDEMRIWARGSGSSTGQQKVRPTLMSNSVDGGSDFDCGDYASWVDGIGCVHDEDVIVTPEDDWMDDPFFDDESVSDDSGGGGLYPPQPGDSECHVVLGCGGGVGPGPDPEPEPCVGNPVKNPRVAAQKKNSGIEGGRFRIGADAVRDGGNRDHFGLDLLVGYGDPLFAMMEGTVRAKGYSDKLGKYVIVSYDISGEDVWMLYGHLKTVGVDYGNISHGAVIGTAGISGNLEGAINDGFAVQHVHLETRVGSWEGTPKDPEDYITTKFDANGTHVSGTDC